MLKDRWLDQLRKSVDVEKMPSVRVRPTLKVEMKKRVMNMSIKVDREKRMVQHDAAAQDFDLNTITDSVLQAMRRRKRAGLGGEIKQMNMIASCQ